MKVGLILQPRPIELIAFSFGLQRFQYFKIFFIGLKKGTLPTTI